jgi:hypothetical protein
MSDDEELPPPDADGMEEELDAPEDDDDDMLVAPPDEAPPELLSAHAKDGRAARRKPRTATMWSAGTAPKAPPTTAADVPRAFVSKPVHYIQNALRYRTMMKPNPAPLLYAEERAINEGIEAYLVSAGLGRTLAAFRAEFQQSAPGTGGAANGRSRDKRPVPTAGRPASEVPLPAIPTMPLYRHVMAAAVRSSALFDDETPWNADNFFASELPFVTLDERGRSQSFATIERLLEKLVLEEQNDTIIPRQIDINFTTVFLVTGSLFVTIDVFLSKMFKLFKTISLHNALLGESRAAAWQARVLRMLSAYLSISRVDVTKLAAERALSFAVSTAHSGGQHVQALRAANDLIDCVQRMGFEDGPRCPRWVQMPYFDPGLFPPVNAAVVAMMRGTDGGGSAHFSPARRGLPSETAVRDLFEMSEVEFAEQLSLCHFQLFRQLGAREFCNAAWNDHLLKKAAAPQLTALLEHRENLIQWVASLIVSPAGLPQRQAVFARLVRVARVLFDQQNYFGAEALLAGVDHSSVRHLTNTVSTSAMESAEVEALSALQAAFDPFHGTAKGVPFNLSSPCIPVVLHFLSELARAHEGSRTVVERAVSGNESPQGPGGATGDGTPPGESPPGLRGLNTSASGGKASAAGQSVLVNWSKMMQIGKVLLRIISYQSLPYEFVPNAAVQRYIAQMPLRRHEDALYELSNERGRSGGG